MTIRFDDLWASADDGASCPVGVEPTRGDGGTETDLLLDAWNRERTGRIECLLVLDQARRLLANLISDGEITPRRYKQACRLIHTIRDVKNAE